MEDEVDTPPSKLQPGKLSTPDLDQSHPQRLDTDTGVKPSKLQFDESIPVDIKQGQSRQLAADDLEINIISSSRRRSRSVRRNSITSGQEHDLDLEQGKPKIKGALLAWLSYQAIGVIYGDIGTSPLYVYSSTFLEPPGYDDLVGVLSLIIWTLTLTVSVKYCLIVLFADDDGEGGTFALYSLLSRYANITDRDPKDSQTIKMERYVTDDIRKPNRNFRNFLEKHLWARNTLKFFSVMGVCLIMADGILTPAQSVLGAIQGLEVVKPDITNAVIVGTTCAILVLLFMVQSFGTSKIASAMAPIVIIWLLFNFCFGVYNLAHFDLSVLKAFSPFYAGQYLVRNKEAGWRSLGGILLAFTGVEALYADLGAFNAASIRISWFCFCYPCLLMAYIGQAAYISVNPSAYSNPFFNAAPPGLFYPSLVISILATIVASQAMITATFQLLSQVMHMSFFPRIKLVHTSSKFYGQIYIPAANWVLMVGTVIVTAVYHNTTKLGEAYGTCVVLVTFITTCMIAMCAIIVWRIHIAIVLPVFLVFACFDGLYLSSALTKFPNGAWFTFMLAVVLAIFLLTWRFGKETQWSAERNDKVAISSLIQPKQSSSEKPLQLTKEFGSTSLTPVPGVGIFFDKSNSAKMAPLVFVQFVEKVRAYQEVMVFFHLAPLTMPHVPDHQKFVITRTAVPGCYAVAVRYGYNEHVTTNLLDRVIYQQLRAWVEENPRRTVPDSEKPALLESTLAEELVQLDRAFANQILFVFGKEQLTLDRNSRRDCGILVDLPRRILLNAFIWIRELTRDKVAEIGVPIDHLVEIGFVKKLQ
jgi:KUP system potassium uptake protein